MEPPYDALRSRIQELETANDALRRREQMLAGQLEDLQRAATYPIVAAGIQELYDQLLAAAIAMLHADFATLQSFVPGSDDHGELRLLRFHGLNPEGPQRWKWVRWATRTTCTEAFRTRQRVACRDVRNAGFPVAASDLQDYLELGIVGAQTTPLLSRSGALLGMLSTYWRAPHELSAEERSALDVLARLAADLIEHSRAEESLRESEERRSLALSAGGMGTFVVNLESGLTSWSPELEAVHGLPPGGYAGTEAAWLALIHPDDRARISQLAENAIQTGNSVDTEWRVVWPDGTVHWIYGRWRVYRNCLGKPVRIVGVNIDVTQRKQMEEDLRRSEERFRLAVQATNDAIWDIDLKTGTVTWNETYANSYGRHESADSMQWWIDRIHPDDRAGTVDSFQAAIAGAATSWSDEYRFRRIDGTWAYIYDRAYIARDSSGAPWRIIGSMQDLTVRKQAEEAIRQSEARFRKMADAAPVMIWLAGPDKLCTFFNKVWLEFRGRTMEQELGNGWMEGVHPEDLDRHYSRYTSAFDDRRSFQMEYRLRNGDGEYRWLLDTGVPMFAPGDVFEGYIGCCVDISELKRAQEENVHRQKLESIGVLAAGIAHDFNNLLGGILAQTQLIAEDVPTQSPAAGELKKIKHLAVRASEIVRELMVYAGRETATLEPVDLSTLVEEMLELLKISISKRVLLNTRLARNLPPILAQASQIRQVVMNLVTNASEAIGDCEGAVTVTTSLEPDAGGYVRLEVSDTGAGIPRERQSKIFDPFYTTKFAGRGLGLAVVQGVVRAHGASIALESAAGSGSTFRIAFPSAVPASVQLARAAHSDVARPAVQPEQHTVLFVEDEETLRAAVAKMLRNRGFLVVEAGDGSTAIDLLGDKNRPIDIVLLDLTIPGAGSSEVIEEVRRTRPETKIVITSAYAQHTGSRFADVPQVVGYIRKPFLAVELASLLKKTISHR